MPVALAWPPVLLCTCVMAQKLAVQLGGVLYVEVVAVEFASVGLVHPVQEEIMRFLQVGG